MFPLFLEYLGKHAKVFVVVVMVLFLIFAFAILLFHLAYHKPKTSSGKFVATFAVMAAMLLLGSLFGLVPGFLGLMVAMLFGRWIRPGHGGRILFCAAVPAAIVCAIWVGVAWDDASSHPREVRRSPEEEAGQKADPPADTSLPVATPPMKLPLADPTKPEGFFAATMAGPTPAFTVVAVEKFPAEAATVPVPEGWQATVTPDADAGRAWVFFTDGNTFFNLHVFDVAREVPDSPSTLLNVLRQRVISREAREANLAEPEQMLITLGYEIERLAPGRVEQNLADSILMMRPAMFKKGQEDTGERSVGSVFVVGFMLNGRLIYGRGSIASADGVDASFLVPAWLNAFMERNRSRIAGPELPTRFALYASERKDGGGGESPAREVLSLPIPLEN